MCLPIGAIGRKGGAGGGCVWERQSEWEIMYAKTERQREWVYNGFHNKQHTYDVMIITHTHTHTHTYTNTNEWMRESITVSTKLI